MWNVWFQSFHIYFYFFFFFSISLSPFKKLCPPAMVCITCLYFITFPTCLCAIFFQTIWSKISALISFIVNKKISKFKNQSFKILKCKKTILICLFFIMPTTTLPSADVIFFVFFFFSFFFNIIITFLKIYVRLSCFASRVSTSFPIASLI